MKDESVRGAALDAALRAMPYLIASHLENKRVGQPEREQMIKLSDIIARWIDDNQ